MNYKRLTIILVVVLILLSAVTVWLWTRPKLSDPAQPLAVLPSTTTASADKTLEAPTTDATPLNSDELVNTYLNSKYRVIGVFAKGNRPQNAEEFKLVDLVQVVVATERATTAGQARQNDTQCGSIYTQPNCYFFIEPLYIYNAPAPKFVAKVSQGAFQPESLVFKSPESIEFKTGDGDAGYGYEITWSMNLNTGKVTQLSKKELQSNP